MPDLLRHHIRDNYDRLPTGERKLADVLLEIGGELAAYSATELAGRAGVSKATAARLVRRLGYADYHELRQQARAQKRSGSPLSELSGALGQEGTLGRHLGHDLACLTRTLETTRPEAANRAISPTCGSSRWRARRSPRSCPL